jgi:prolyl-tRNA synthetase
VAEGTLDELGLCWPRGLAPADVHVVATGKDAAVFAAAAELVDAMAAGGLDVLFDDRVKVSPGVKFMDAELIGVPTIVVVGKGLEATPPVAEIKDRRTGERREVPVDALVDAVVAEVRAG